MSLRILNTIGEAFAPEAKEILEKVGEVDYRIPSQDELYEDIKNYDVVLVGLGLNIDQKVIDNGVALKAIATATTGLDHIDVKYAEEKKVDVLSLRGETEFLNTITGTAELACGLMIDLLRFTSHAFDSVKKYEWNRNAFRGHSLYGQTLGIVGMGRLGTWMARYGKAFGMTVVFYDPHIEESTVSVEECTKVSFDELLEKSDVVSIHIHLLPETKHLFNKDALAKMKDSAYLVNTSRGSVVDEDELLKNLQQNKLAGYATDVLAGELSFDKRFSNHPLVEYAKKNQNCIIVPHIGGMTHESRRMTDVFMADKVQKYFTKQ